MPWPNLPERPEVTLEQLRLSVGSLNSSVWLTIDQAMVDDFAASTGDDAFIHVAPERAARTRFGGAIAHGLLVLSLLPWLLRSAIPVIRGTRMGVNLGYDKVRFLQPVPVGSRIRGNFTLDQIEQRSGGLTVLHYRILVEIDGATKPALVCSWLLGRWIMTDD